jgi:hypothetical protein
MAKPRLILHRDGKDTKLQLPEPGALSVAVPGETCRHCKQLLVVAGAKRRIGGHDFYESDAGCVHCNAFIGYLRLYVSTLFGIAEDERVLNSYVRIY